MLWQCQDCRHGFCSVRRTAAPSCRQVLKEEECKARWVLSSHTDHAHRAADEAKLAQQPLSPGSSRASQLSAATPMR